MYFLKYYIYIYISHSKLQIYCHAYQKLVTKIITLILNTINRIIVPLQSIHT
jgi:hypothetical protein